MKDRKSRKLKSKIIEKFGTQTAFARRVKETETAVSRVVQGHNELPEDRKRKWARALGANVDELFGGK